MIVHEFFLQYLTILTVLHWTLVFSMSFLKWPKSRWISGVNSITTEIFFYPLVMFLLMFLWVSSKLVCEVCLIWNESKILADIQTGIHWLLSLYLTGLLLSQLVSSQPMKIYIGIFLRAEIFILFILNTMRLQLVHFCVFLWSFWIKILPFGISINFLLDVSSSINLLRVYYATSSSLLMKILNNTRSSIDPRVALYLCQMNIKLLITAQWAWQVGSTADFQTV